MAGNPPMHRYVYDLRVAAVIHDALCPEGVNCEERGGAAFGLYVRAARRVLLDLVPALAELMEEWAQFYADTAPATRPSVAVYNVAMAIRSITWHMTAYLALHANHAQLDAARCETTGVREELTRTDAVLQDTRATLAMRDGQLREARAELERLRSPALRDARIEAAREALGWEYESVGEYADVMRETLTEVVDAVLAATAAPATAEGGGR